MPSSTSLRALDALNLFLADVRDGMGPFLGTFLRESHRWNAGRVGMALAASQIGTVLARAKGPTSAFDFGPPTLRVLFLEELGFSEHAHRLQNSAEKSEIHNNRWTRPSEGGAR